MNNKIVQRAAVLLAQVFVLVSGGFLWPGRGYSYELAGRKLAAQPIGNLGCEMATFNGKGKQPAKRAVSPCRNTSQSGPIRLNPTQSG